MKREEVNDRWVRSPSLSTPKVEARGVPTALGAMQVMSKLLAQPNLLTGPARFNECLE